MFGSIIGCVFMCPKETVCDISFKSSVEAIRWEIENNKKTKTEGVAAKKG